MSLKLEYSPPGASTRGLQARHAGADPLPRGPAVCWAGAGQANTCSLPLIAGFFKKKMLLIK